MARYKQGKYVLKNPTKYVGQKDNVVFRSSWEEWFHNFLDSNTDILAWGSECVAIPYLKPTDGKVHKYYPDYYIKYKNKRGEIVQEIVEIKPKRDMKFRRNNTAHQNDTIAVNYAKWSHAQNWCKANNLNFRILTEDQLFPKPKKVKK